MKLNSSAGWLSIRVVKNSRDWIVFILVSLNALWGELASGAVTLDFSRQEIVDLNPGESFSFDVFLTISGAGEVTGFEYYLQALGDGYENFFRLTSRMSAGSDFPDLNVPDETLAGVLLDPEESFSLGASVLDPFVPVSTAGTYFLARFEIFVEPSAGPGIFQISPWKASWIDQDILEQVFASTPILLVYVIPEPQTISILIPTFLVGLFLSLLRVCIRQGGVNIASLVESALGVGPHFHGSRFSGRKFVSQVKRPSAEPLCHRIG